MILVDCVARLLPGALGAEDGAADDSFAQGLLDHPQYTKPADFRGLTVPEVLQSGDHARIAAWRRSRRCCGRRSEDRTCWQGWHSSEEERALVRGTRQRRRKEDDESTSSTRLNVKA